VVWLTLKYFTNRIAGEKLVTGCQKGTEIGLRKTNGLR